MEIDLESNLKKLGRNISLMRKKRNFTQYKLAQEILTDQSNLARIEEGKVNPTVKTLIKINTALGCRVKDLFDF